MKKFIYTIALFSFIWLSPSLSVKASFQPPVTPDTSMVPGFLQTVAQTQIVNDTGLYSNYKPDYDTLNTIVNGRTIQGSMTEVYVDNATFTDMDDYVNSQGQYVTASDTFTAFGSSDVGRYSYVADKNTGEILSFDWNGTLKSTLQAGDASSMPYPIWLLDQLDHLAAPTLQNYQDVVALIEDAEMHNRLDIYDESQLTQAQKEFIDNNDFYLYMHSNSQGWDCYVANGCTVNCVISGNGVEYHGVVTGGQSLPNGGLIYATSPTQATFVNGNTSNYGYLRDNPVNYFGRSWRYTPRWMNSYNVLGNGGYLDFKSPTQAQFNQAISLQSKYVVAQPVEVTNQNDQYYYDYSSVYNNPPQYHTTVNNNYTINQPISPENYPVNNTLTINYPSNDTEHNYINYIYNYYTTPSQGESIGTIDPENVTNGIPILNNLKYRFPFSIPFDIYELISGLAVDREAPSFYWEVYLPVIDYTWVIDFDLSAWNTQAQIFRTCFLILFIIALGMWAYNHFFGS